MPNFGAKMAQNWGISWAGAGKLVKMINFGQILVKFDQKWSFWPFSAGHRGVKWGITMLDSLLDFDIGAKGRDFLNV